MSMDSVIVTGGAGGIGASICRLLAGQGYGVAAFDLETPDRLQREFATDGLQISLHEVDVTSRADIDAAVYDVEQQLGPVWGLVNCAGIAPEVPFLKTDEELLDRVYAVNVRGPFSCIQAVAPLMIERGDGRIVNITSTSATLGFAMLSAYDASKAALAQLTRTLAVEFGHTGVRVNSVAPGTILTELSVDWLERGRVADHEADRIPAGRFGQPEDIAKAVGFLLHRDNEWINGTVLTVDGGHTITGLPFFEELRG